MTPRTVWGTVSRYRGCRGGPPRDGAGLFLLHILKKVGDLVSLINRNKQTPALF
jgi:hypothetical protein